MLHAGEHGQEIASEEVIRVFVQVEPGSYVVEHLQLGIAFCEFECGSDCVASSLRPISSNGICDVEQRFSAILLASGEVWGQHRRRFVGLGGEPCCVVANRLEPVQEVSGCLAYRVRIEATDAFGRSLAAHDDGNAMFSQGSRQVTVSCECFGTEEAI